MNFHPELGYYDEGLDLTDPALYADAGRDFGRARVLTPVAIRSRVFQELEDEKLWTREWCCIGWTGEIASPGDLLPYTLGNHGIHVQRENGGLVGRFNFAQHGGCRFIPLQCQQGTKTKCSYTSCGYSRDRGVVRRADLPDDSPVMHHFVGDRPERAIGVNVDQWGSLIFVNVDQGCQTLISQIGHVQDELAVDLSGCVPLQGFWAEHPGNWKIFAPALMAALCNAYRATGREVALTPDPTVLLADRKPPNHLVARCRGRDGEADTLLCWVYPNLIFEIDGRRMTTAIIQPTAIRQTMARIMVGTFDGTTPPRAAESDGEDPKCREWRQRLKEVGEQADRIQLSHGEWGTPHRPETSLHELPRQDIVEAYGFQRYLIDRLLTPYEYVWNAPLYSRGPA